MHPIVIELPDLLVSVDTERPIDEPTQVRVYIGPDIELVMTECMADRLTEALVDTMAAPIMLPVRH
jgi:hypothetical protein